MRVMLMACALCLGACSTSSRSPSMGSTGSSSGASASTSAEGTGAAERPKGAPQPRLPLGKVVLSAPPRPPVELSVEVADTESTRRYGLMFRESLSDGEGMFFVFPQSAPLSFWMRNTLIPLDMFFIDSQFRVVGVVENAEPLTETSRRVEGESQYVLEVNAGFAAKHGLGPGTQLRYTPPSGLTKEN